MKIVHIYIKNWLKASDKLHLLFSDNLSQDLQGMNIILDRKVEVEGSQFTCCTYRFNHCTQQRFSTYDVAFNSSPTVLLSAWSHTTMNWG